MSAPVKKCEVCDDTGSKSRDIGGDLDCVACGAADERVAMRDKLGPMMWAEEVYAWRAYQLGKAAAGRDDIIVTLRNQYSVLEQALAIESAALGEALRHVANLKDRLNAAPVVPVAAQPVVQQEPIAYLKYWAAQSWSGCGDHEIEYGEGLEVCEAGEIGADKLPAFPVYAAPSLEAQPAGEVERDAARWRQVLRYVGADRSPALMCSYFVLRGIHAVPGTDLMRGSVAGHFTEAIDAAMAQGEKAK